MPKYIIDKMVPGVSNKHCLLPFVIFSICSKHGLVILGYRENRLFKEVLPNSRFKLFERK